MLGLSSMTLKFTVLEDERRGADQYHEPAPSSLK